jgi:hypothetical protein
MQIMFIIRHCGLAKFPKIFGIAGVRNWNLYCYIHVRPQSTLALEVVQRILVIKFGMSQVQNSSECKPLMDQDARTNKFI